MRPIDGGIPTLWLPTRLRRRLFAAARAVRPREACGALLGSSVAGRGRVVDILPLTNRAADGRRSYRIDPAELEPLLRTREILGFYHSHPGADAAFSAMDSRLAWPAWWYVVIGTCGEGPRLTVWRDGRRGRLDGDRHDGRSGRRGGGRRRGRPWPS